MRLSDIASTEHLQEAIPPVAPGIAAPVAPGVNPAAAPQPGQQAPGQQVNPQVAALAMKQTQEKKKQIQDQIAATEKQLQDLRKQLAQIR